GIARLVKAVASSRDRSSSFAPIIDLLEQLAQRRDVGLVEFAMAAEVRHQRCHPAFEQAREQAFALAEQPGFALQHRGIEIAASLPPGLDRALFQQTVEQGLDRGLLPLLPAGERRDHVLGRQGRGRLPEHLHDHGFGVADLHSITSVNVVVSEITPVIDNVKGARLPPLPRARYRARAAWTMCSTVNPNSGNRASAGALAPKLSMPITAPSRPTYLRQKSAVPASIATRLRHAA